MKIYRFRKFNLFKYIIDMILQPFMYIFGSKDAHWWDWERIDIDQSKLNNVKILMVGNGMPRRKFPVHPIVGRFNITQLKSLFVTLFVLPNTNVLKPIDYKGKWSLISYKNHIEGLNKMFFLSNFINVGAIKNLSDGEVGYLGITLRGELIELELIAVTSRFSNRHLLFV